MVLQAFLVIVVMSTGHGQFLSSTVMPSMNACFEALLAVKIVAPNGDENEGMAVAFCATEDHTNFLGQWY